MEYSPEAFVRLSIQALILGATLSLLYSVLKIPQILFGDSGDTPVADRLRSFSFPLIGVPSERRSSKRHGSLVRQLITFFEDVLFGLCISMGILLLAFVGNNGRIRWFLLAGTLIGFVLCRITLGRISDRFSDIFAIMIRILFRYVTFFFLLPIRLLAKGTVKLFRRLGAIFKKRIQQKREALFRQNEEKRLLSAALNGFGCAEYLNRGDHIAGPIEAIDPTYKTECKGVRYHGTFGTEKTRSRRGKRKNESPHREA